MKNLSSDTYINFLLFLPIELKGSPLPYVHSYVVLFRIWEWAKGSRLVHCPSIFSVTYFWYLVHCFLFFSLMVITFIYLESVCAYLYMCTDVDCVVYMCMCPPVLVCMVCAHVQAEIDVGGDLL